MIIKQIQEIFMISYAKETFFILQEGLFFLRFLPSTNSYSLSYGLKRWPHYTLEGYKNSAVDFLVLYVRENR